MKPFTIYTDGAARGNPGPAGAGWLIFNAQGECVAEGKRYLGELTNNQAEYRALLLALEEIPKMEDCKETGLTLYSDSELLVKQLQGEYKVKNQGLKSLFRDAIRALSQFQKYSVNYIPREKNERADALANQAIDEYFG